MSSCLRRTFSFRKTFPISFKSNSKQYFSALSSARNRISSNNNFKNGIILKLNKPTPVFKRSFSLEPIQNFYDELNSSTSCKLAKEILVGVHDFTGFSWTLTIIAASAALKLFITFPCAVYQRFLVSKIELTKIELDGVVKGLKEKILLEARKKKWTEKRAKYELMSEVGKHWRKLLVKNNCHPFKTIILVLIEFPFWLVLTVAIRRLAIEISKGQSDHPVAGLQFQVGGPFWSPNLSLPDPTYILPTINFLFLVMCTELSFITGAIKTKTRKKFNLLQKFVWNIMRLFTLVVFLISALSPSALSLFWASNSILTLAQRFLIMSPKVRSFFRVPKVPSESNKPYSEAWNTFSEKFRILSSRKE